MVNRAVGEWRGLPTWCRYLVILLLIGGIFCRFYHLDRKVYWVDEAYTTLRMSGHTKVEVEREVFTGQVVGVETLQHYQRLSPDKGWDDTLKALQGNAEHPPLFFLMARGWTEIWGYSVFNMRLLPVLLSLLIFPALWWLCWELFESSIVGWLAVGLVAISPLFVLYAQEARPYSLWTLMTVLSSAALLWAIRTQQRLSWGLYAGTIAIGLYTQLLFGFVGMAHGLYVVLLDRVLKKRQLSHTVRSYLLATGVAVAAFLPWLWVIVSNFGQVQGSTVTLTRAVRFERLFREWMVTFSRLWLDLDLKFFNYFVAAFALFGLYFLCRHANRRVWLLVLTLVLVPFLALAIPDMAFGGQRSSRLRYLFPCYVGLQIAVAYWLVSLSVWSAGWKRTLGQLLLAGVVIGGIVGIATNAQAEVWWNKSESRSGYYPAAAKAINKAENPLIVSDGPTVDTIAFSYRLKPEVKFQLIDEQRLADLKLATGFKSVFLLNPSQDLRQLMAENNYQVNPVNGTRSKSRRVLYNLWKCKRQKASQPPKARTAEPQRRSPQRPAAQADGPDNEVD